MPTRIENYTNKLVPARVAEDFTNKKPSMVSKLSITWVQYIYPMLIALPALLAGQAPLLLRAQVGSYFAFMQECAAAKRMHPDATVLEDYAEIEAKWVTRGLTSDICDQILGGDPRGDAAFLRQPGSKSNGPGDRLVSFWVARLATRAGSGRDASSGGMGHHEAASSWFCVQEGNTSAGRPSRTEIATPIEDIAGG